MLLIKILMDRIEGIAGLTCSGGNHAALVNRHAKLQADLRTLIGQINNANGFLVIVAENKLIVGEAAVASDQIQGRKVSGSLQAHRGVRDLNTHMC